MNILIIGEFSGFAKHLKQGFTTLGHNVIVVQNGDGFKQIPAECDDIRYKKPSDLCLFGKKLPHTHVFFNLKASQELGDRILSRGIMYNIIIVICSTFVTNSYRTMGVPINVVKHYVNKGAKLILTSCGSDPAYRKYVCTQKYFNIAFPNGVVKYSRDKYKVFDELTSMSTKVIVTAFDYYDTIKKYFTNDLHIGMEKVEFIPLPISYEEDITTDCMNRKIVIFHGITRPEFKGTKFFKEALAHIQKEFPEKVEIIIDGRMPYEKYCKALYMTDILLDQTNSYGSGVNCALGLVKGKVVLSGNEPEECSIRGYESPVINATPNSEQIYQTIKRLVLNPELIMSIKHASREYAIRYQESSTVAKEYINSIL